LKYLQLKFVELIAHIFPRRVGYGVARRLADLYFRLDRRGRESVMANLRRIHAHSQLALSQRGLRALARENFLNFAKYLVDFFHFLRVNPERLRRLIDYGDLPVVLDRLLEQGRGVICVTAHLGNWELGAAATAALGYRVNAVVLWQPDPKLNELYQRQRMARQINLIPMGRAARGCVAALRRNEIVGLVTDRDYTGSRRAVEFFGHPARLPDGPAKLALKTGAPILPLFLVRNPDDTFRFVRDEPIIVNPQTDTLDNLMAKIARALERVIRQHSEQWFLFHDMWNLEQDRRLATRMAFGAPADADSDQPAGGDAATPAQPARHD
jgi:lauroyl/myristoyl acyltransferase